MNNQFLNSVLCSSELDLYGIGNEFLIDSTMPTITKDPIVQEQAPGASQQNEDLFGFLDLESHRPPTSEKAVVNTPTKDNPTCQCSDATRRYDLISRAITTC
jgi:hypothetical protein